MRDALWVSTLLLIGFVACGGESDDGDDVTGGSGGNEAASGAGGSGGSTDPGSSGSGGDTASGGSPGAGSGGAPASCPFTTAPFTCAAACDNLWQIADKCADDPSLEGTNLQTVLAVMVGRPENQAKTACKATCAVDSASFPYLWACFQAVPSTSACVTAAGCSMGNCL